MKLYDFMGKYYCMVRRFCKNCYCIIIRIHVKNNGIAIYFRENIAIIIYDFVKTQLQKYAIL